MFTLFFKRLRILVLIPLTIFLLAACGGGVSGTYVATPDGGGSITLELGSDSRAAITLRDPDGAELPTVEGSWSQEGDQITTVLGGDQDVYTLTDGNLTINAFGENLVFEKQ